MLPFGRASRDAYNSVSLCVLGIYEYLRPVPHVLPLLMNRYRSRFATPLVVGAMSGLCVLTRGHAWAFVVLICAGAVLTVRELLHILKRPNDLTAFRALAVALLAGYSLGPALSIVMWHLGSSSHAVLLAGPFAYHGYEPFFSLASALALGAIATLLFADGFTPRIPVLRLDLLRFAAADRVSLVAMAAVVITALLTSDLGYMGTTVRTNDTVTLLGSLGGTVLPALVPVLLVAFIHKSSDRLWRALLLVLLASMCAILVIQGRRVLIVSAFTALVLVRLYETGPRRNGNAPQLRLARKPILLATITGAFLIVGVYYFFALRLATAQDGEDAALDARTAVAMQILRQDQHGFLAFASAQAVARSGTLPGYLSSLLKSHAGGRLMGECLFANTITAIPRAVFPAKGYWMSRYSCADERVNAAYALPQTDSPASLVTQGYADFGWLGALVYPLLIGVIMQLTLATVRVHGIVSIKAFAIAAVFFASFFVEQSLSFYMVTVRNLAIVIAFGSLVGFIGTISPRVRIRTPRA